MSTDRGVENLHVVIANSISPQRPEVDMEATVVHERTETDDYVLISDDET